MAIHNDKLFVSYTSDDSIVSVDLKTGQVHPIEELNNNYLQYPTDMMIENEDLYVLDTKNQRVVKFNLMTKGIKIIASNNNEHSELGKKTNFIKVENIVKVGDSLWIKDYENLHKIDLKNSSIHIINSPHLNIWSYWNFNGFTTDGSNLFTQMQFTHELLRYNLLDEEFHRFVGRRHSDTLEDGNPRFAKLGLCIAMTVHQGYLYAVVMSYTDEYVIRKVDLSTGFVSTI